MFGEEKVGTPLGIAEEKTIQTLHRNRLWRYGPMVLWAILISIGSSDLLAASHTSAFLIRPLHWLFPGASDTTLALIHTVIRKAAHFAEYAVLAWLAARAFQSSSRDFLRARWFWISLAFVIVYSLFDEFHQSFVASRTASIYDSMIDTAGGLTMLLLIAIRYRPQRVSEARA